METDQNEAIESGWVQINNTVMPYVTRNHGDRNQGDRLVPLAVVMYGAGLLRDRTISTVPATPTECATLTQRCQDANLEFQFCPEENVELVKVAQLECTCPVVINWLPGDNPFSQTRVVTAEQLSTKQETCFGYGYHVNPEKNCTVDKVQESAEEMAVDLTKGSSCLNSFGSQYLPADGSGVQQEPLDLSLKSVGAKPSSITSVEIVPAMLMGRKIPCIVKRGVHYVLVETLRRAYFPQCSLRALMFMVNRSINPFVYDLNQSDVSAIMTFCKNPTSLGRSTKVISFHDAKQLLPMFRSFLRKVSEQRQARKSSESPPSKKNTGTTDSKQNTHTVTQSKNTSPGSPPLLFTTQESVQNFKISNIQRQSRPLTLDHRSRKLGRSRNLQDALRRLHTQHK